MGLSNTLAMAAKRQRQQQQRKQRSRRNRHQRRQHCNIRRHKGKRIGWGCWRMSMARRKLRIVELKGSSRR